MSARQSLPSRALLASLLVLGLGIGFAMHSLRNGRSAAVARLPWLSDAIRAATPSAVRDAVAQGGARPPFVLRATLVSSDPAGSRATFDLGKGQIHVLHPGSTLPGVGRLLAVASESVQIEVDGRPQQFFIEYAPRSGQISHSIQSLPQGAVYEGNPGTAVRGRSAPAPRFVVPDNLPRVSDAPRNEPELDATPRPGQSIDTTVWD